MKKFLIVGIAAASLAAAPALAADMAVMLWTRARARLGGAMPTDLLDLLGPPGWCSGRWPHDGEVAGGAPLRG
jgi:hypothetical protein